MQSLTDCYKVLDLEPGSTKEEIKQAYRKLAQQWHPDKYTNRPDQLQQAREKFEKIKAAYEQLIYFQADAKVSLGSNSAQDYYEEGILNLQEDRYEQAIEYFSQAIRQKADYLKAYQARAFALEQLGLPLRAEADFNKVAELKQSFQWTPAKPASKPAPPSDAEVYFQRGLTQFKARKYGAAIENLSTAIRINPNHQAAYRYRSQAYFRRGYDEQANADFKRMCELEQHTQQTTPESPQPATPADVPSWRCTQTLSRHTDVVSAIAITRDSKKLVTASHDKTVRLWSLKTGSLLKTFSAHSNKVHCVAISWDGKLIASGSADKTIKLWDARTGALLRSFGNFLLGHSDTVTSLVFSPNNQSLASASLDTTVRLWSLKSGKELYAIKDYSAPILALSMSWDGKNLAYGGKGELVNLHHTKTGKLVRSFSIKRLPAQAIALSRQESLLAAGSAANIVVWNRHYQKKLFELKGHSERVSSLAFSTDSQTLISGSHDKTIKLWHATTGEKIDTLIGHQAAVYAVACSLDGKTIVSSSADKTVKIWQRE